MRSITSLVKDLYHGMRSLAPVIGIAAVVALSGCDGRIETIHRGCYEGTVKGMKATYCENYAHPYVDRYDDVNCTLKLEDEKVKITIYDGWEDVRKESLFGSYVLMEYYCKNHAQNVEICNRYNKNLPFECNSGYDREMLEEMGEAERFDGLLKEAYENIYLPQAQKRKEKAEIKEQERKIKKQERINQEKEQTRSIMEGQ